MPEGHIVHRLAARYLESFQQKVSVDSPQGRFAQSAAKLDGRAMTDTEAHGKHLFLGFDDDWIRIHLGIYGKVRFGPAPPPAPVGAIRLRLHDDSAFADLRGPAACELITPAEKRVLQERLGPDPLRPDADSNRVWDRVRRSRTTVAALLMDQNTIAGVGNVYRAEVLFRNRIDPYLAGRDLAREEWETIWADLVELMGYGARVGRIDTVRPEHTPEAMNRPPRVDDHGGEVYVYRRAGHACHVCETEVRIADLGGRNLFWCPACQKR
ncbi:MAG: Fpg/Nei family DNA glycosylase [Stackebrandtia sp.]